MKKYTTVLLYALFTTVVLAQEAPKQSVSVGISGGYAAAMNLYSIPVAYTHQISQVKGLYYSAGLRQNLAFGDQNFTINGQEALIDDISNYSLNIMAGLEYRYQKASIGLNVDLFGLNVGTRSYKTVGTDPVYKITPQLWNVAGSGGCTNNEFYLGYAFTDNFAARIGISYYNMSLTYSSQKTAETSAYTGVLLPMLNIRYTLWQK